MPNINAKLHDDFELTRSSRINPGDSGRNEVRSTHECHLRPTRLCPNEVRF